MAIDFITEYKKLQSKTPRIGSFILSSVNSDYNYNVENIKNCYLLSNAVENVDCMYGRDFYGNKDCVDCDHISGCTLCYMCLNSKDCYNCDYLQDSLNCSDCRFGYDLKGCKDCIGCCGLSQKQYYIFNKPYTKEEYFKKREELTDKEIKAEFLNLKRRVPRKGIISVDSEDFTGDSVFHSRNVQGSFDVSECQDAGFLLECKKVTDSWDITILENAQQCYQISSCHVMNNSNFCFFCVECSDVEFSECLMSCQDCFGCISLHRKQYYILNEPYSAEEYFKKCEEYRDQLREQGLYGQMIIPSVFPREDTVVEWKSM